MRRLMPVIPVLGLLMLTGATCNVTPSDPTTPQKREAALRPFQSAEEMRAYFADQAVARVTANGSYGGGLGWDSLVTGTVTDTSGTGGATPPTPGAPEATNGSGSDDRFSTTNIQEAGVDEGDVVKNDGNYIYLLKGNTVRIVKAVPPDALQQVASVDLPQTADSLYLYGDKLIALSHSWGYWGYWGIGVLTANAQTQTTPVKVAEVDTGSGSSGDAVSDDSSASSPSVIAPTPPDAVAPPAGDATSPPEDATSVNQTTVTILNVADPSAPAAVATLTFDGDLNSSRLIQNKLHLVLTTMPPLPANPTPDAIRAEPLDAWLPNYEIAMPDGTSTTGKTVTWESFYYPANPDGYGITMVITVDVDNPNADFKPVALSADAGTIYASTSSLYVTDTNYDYTLMSSREDTIVHKFDLTGETARYVASGLVPGRLLNQYSLGENNGYLRMASSIQNYSGPIIMPLPMAGGTGSAAGGSATASSGSVSTIAQAATTQTQNGNAVYVLHEGATAGQLDIVGRIEGIAAGEQLYSARFIGDRGFLVTFKKVDPLFTIDLSDPTNPKLAGELKVPGYSEYIHLMDENHLLTIGKDAVDAATGGDFGDFAWYQGVLLSIFDVTDLANPQLLHKEVIGTRGTDSEAATNPKAFNYFKAKDALAIPIDLYEGQTTGPEYGTHTFTGVYVYNVTVGNGFSLLGRISTTDVSSPSWGDMPYWYSYDLYTRGIFMGDNVYAVTDSVVRAAPIAAPSNATGTLTLLE
jgi:uncharacterized secreted protein with C-terminal beta-propeller domain